MDSGYPAWIADRWRLARDRGIRLVPARRRGNSETLLSGLSSDSLLTHEDCNCPMLWAIACAFFPRRVRSTGSQIGDRTSVLHLGSTPPGCFEHAHWRIWSGLAAAPGCLNAGGATPALS